jgi:hypothetical protein
VALPKFNADIFAKSPCPRNGGSNGVGRNSEAYSAIFTITATHGGRFSKGGEIRFAIPLYELPDGAKTKMAGPSGPAILQQGFR